ncbi:DUF3592 domain-containing protein [Kribbella italica]|uniref:DUF3592 domain-containing protein n=1 Tax=Kribbella italica TaxID=1540520 RepID=A0A7W9JEZ7_9ACTN|nr:DUF3592 domain-containing protein [Kribbella italica]MBB5840878.1 hypothetical protein [Kribbella italica]
MTSRKTPEARRAEAARRRAKRVAARQRREGRSGRQWDFDGVLYLVVGCVALAFGCWLARDVYYLQHRGEVVPATVLHKTNGKNERIDVRYTTKAGETIEDSTTNFVDATVGGTIDVVYDPQEPTRMQATDWGYDYVLPGLVGAFGIGFLAYGPSRFRTRGWYS